MKSRAKWLKRSPMQKSDTRTAYLMLLPIVTLLTIFVVIPLFYAASVSFYQWSFYQESVFIGFSNYELVIKDKFFWKSIWTGVKFALIVIPSQFVLAFLFAHVLKNLRGKIGSLVKTTIYIPAVISGIIAASVFTYIYDYQGGLANYLLGFIGIEPVAWLADIKFALASISFPAIWFGFGVTTLMMLAGLNDIPKSYYEAAEMDGATTLTKMRFITIPLMKNLFLYLLVSGTTAAIQQFEIPYIMTAGGPLNETMTPNMHIFQHFRNDPYLGYTISSSLLLFLILGFISMLIFRTVNSEKSLDS